MCSAPIRVSAATVMAIGERAVRRHAAPEEALRGRVRRSSGQL